jgi:hypothetical protein
MSLTVTLVTVNGSWLAVENHQRANFRMSRTTA